MKYALGNITAIFNSCKNKKVFIIVDKNTYKFCWEKIKPIQNYAKKIIIIKTASGEKYKNIDAVVKIWNTLTQHNASKSDMVINLGGGIITDTGGFAAATYKRGINFINIPTTLLGMVDAAAGNKNGINFMGYKNLIGTFAVPQHIIIDIDFLKTLPEQHIISGYAEIIKTALIADAVLFEKLLKPTLHTFINNKKNILDVVNAKMTIVNRDPFEKDDRKILNFGHTFGHAFESIAILTQKKLTHGEAIAMGMICELWLSVKYAGLKRETQQSIENFILKIFPIINFNKENIKDFILSIYQDKKNKANRIYPVLLKDVGKPIYTIAIDKKDVVESLNYYMNLKNNI